MSETCETCAGYGLVGRIMPARDEVNRRSINPVYSQIGCRTCCGTGKQPKEAELRALRNAGVNLLERAEAAEAEVERLRKALVLFPQNFYDFAEAEVERLCQALNKDKPND